MRHSKKAKKGYQAIKCIIDPEAVLSVELGKYGIEVTASAFVDDFADPRRWQSRADRRIDVAGVVRPSEEGVQLPVSDSAFMYLSQGIADHVWTEWAPQRYTTTDGTDVHAWQCHADLLNTDGSYHSRLYITQYENGDEVYHIHMPVDAQALLLDSLYKQPAMRELKHINMVILPAEDAATLSITPAKAADSSKTTSSAPLSKWGKHNQIILYSNAYNGPQLQACLKAAIPSAVIHLEDTDALIAQQHKQVADNDAIREFLKRFNSFGSADKALTTPHIKPLSSTEKRALRSYRKKASTHTRKPNPTKKLKPLVEVSEVDTTKAPLSSASSTTISSLTTSPATLSILRTRRNCATTENPAPKVKARRRKSKTRYKTHKLWGVPVDKLLQENTDSASDATKPLPELKL